MTARLHFLAYVRQGLAAAGTSPDPIDRDIPVRQPVTVGVRLAGRAERSFGVRLYGPGDVRGIDNRQVIRVEPAPDARDFEPTNLVTIEFDRPDFPWLFTPAAPGTRQRLRPWLFLVVVPVDRCAVRTDAGPLPVLECDLADLPSLADSWAWAHAQVATVDDRESVADVLAADPSRTLSRLICPRRLEPGTAYRACLVPAFEPGRLAGLGLVPADDAPYAPAWRPGTGDAPPLPVYHSWEFATGPDGDFRTLAARLQPRATGPDVGLRPVLLGPAGVPELGADVPTVALGFEGALRGALTMPSHWPVESREPFGELLRSLITDTATTLGPPLYGGSYAHATRVPGDVEPPHWLRELNLDPRHRAAAALGSRVIRERQESLMAAAWEQAAEVQRANEALRQAQLAAEVSRSTYERRIATGTATAAARLAVAATAPVPAGRLLQLSGAVLDAVTLSPRSKRLVGAELHRNPTAAATLSAPFRRLARPGGPLARRAGDGLDSIVEAAATNEVTATAAPRPPAGTVLFDEVAGDGIAFHLINRTRFDNATPWWREPAATGLAGAGRTQDDGGDTADGPAVAEATADGDPIATALALSGDRDGGGTRFQVATPLVRMLPREPTDPPDPWPWPDPDPEPDPEPEPQPEPLPVPYPDTSALPAGVPGSPTGVPTMVLSPPSQAVGGARVFVNTSDGRLFERFHDGAGWVWLDRGAPPGTRAAPVEPGGVMDGGKRLFVASAFGHLFEHYWDGDRWLWRQHPWPPNSYGLGTAPALVLNNQSLFVATTHNGTANVGRLWERRRDGDKWTWWDHGNPGGQKIITNPGAAHGNTRFFVGTDTGALWERQWNGTRWIWVPHGNPPGTGVADLGPAWGSSSLFIKARNGNLFERFHDGTRWHWRDHGPPLSSQIANMAYGIVSPGQGSSLFVGGVDGRLYERRFQNGNWSWHDQGRPPGQDVSVMQPPGGAMDVHGTMFVSGSNGKLYAIRKSGTSWAWDDHGVPLDSRGAGPVTAEPPADPRWALPLGFLSNLVAAHVDNPSQNNYVYHRIGRDLGFEAEVRRGWSAPTFKPGSIGWETQGLGIAVADVSDNGQADLIMMWVDNPGGANSIHYQIGWDMNQTGVVTGGWSPSHRVPAEVAAEVQGADLAVADLDGDGRPELIVAYVTGGTSPRLYYRIGWRLDTQGRVTGGWSDSIPVPNWTTQPVRGVGVAVADLNDDQKPDIVLLTIEPQGSTSRAVYRIGRRINGRGQVIGGWAPPKEVGGGTLPADHHGAGIAVVDVTGTRRADLVLFHLANTAGENSGWYRVGWDLDHNGIAERWSTDAPVAGWFGDSNQGAAITIADIDPGLATTRQRMGDDFTSAALRHQHRVLAAQELVTAPAAETVDTNALATRVTDALDPVAGITGRIVDRLELPGDGGVPALHQLVVVPQFPDPMYEAVKELSQELLFPGASQIPPDTLTLLRVNSTFVESFMVGLNSELSREMLWRRYPTDPRATFFRQFWDTRSGEPTVGPLTDLPPIADWTPDNQLGENATAVGAGDMLVVLIRGELLRRYPGTALYVQRAVVENGVRRPGAEVREPQFTGFLEPDMRFFGLPLSVSDARGGGTDPGWFVVLRQPPTDSRFGSDSAPGEPHNSAHHARTLLRRPVMVAVHASDMVPPIDDTWNVDATVQRANGVPQHRIVALAGTRSDGTPWRMSAEEVIDAIGRHERFMVERPVGDRVRVRVSRTGAGRPYLTTEADGDLPNNLLSLPQLAEDAS